MTVFTTIPTNEKKDNEVNKAKLAAVMTSGGGTVYLCARLAHIRMITGMRHGSAG
jgi:hypothetical protein